MIKDLGKALGSKIVKPIDKPSPGKPLLQALKSGTIPLIRIPGRSKPPDSTAHTKWPMATIGIPSAEQIRKILTPGSTLK